MTPAFRHDVKVNVLRAVRLLKREGFAAIPKGVAYLIRRFIVGVARRKILSASTPKERFTEIYRRRLWSEEGSASGPGSSLSSTANLRRCLPTLFEEFGIKRVLDAPCGDFAWMRHVTDGLPNLDYIGADIVEPLIEDNEKRFGRAGVRFVCLDITEDPLPAADLWLCRDCFCHLSLEDITKALQRFADSKIPYILTSTWPQQKKDLANTQIATGDFRPVNLLIPPFQFPEPLRAITDQDLGTTRMCLWSREQLLPFIKTLP